MVVHAWHAPLLALLLSAALTAWSQDEKQAVRHPNVITPGIGMAAPSDAIVLFDGSDLSQWTKPGGAPAGWQVMDRVMLAVRGQRPVVSRRSFDDMQLHLEFATPAEPEGSGQGRGNSGVYLQARYEVQVLDSYDNETYPDGQCGAVYGQHSPLVNACRGPGQWQSYDIIFHAARFDGEGSKIENARLSVLHNGVLIQDHVDVSSSTTAAMQSEGPAAGPLYL